MSMQFNSNRARHNRIKIDVSIKIFYTGNMNFKNGEIICRQY